MLHGRLFSYGDAQRYRLGVNHRLIPVNAARCPFHSYHRDGAMRVDGNHGSTLATNPTAMGNGSSNRNSPSRLSAWKAPPTTGIIARTKTTTPSPAGCSG